jgi:hypothetical protein
MDLISVAKGSFEYLLRDQQRKIARLKEDLRDAKRDVKRIAEDIRSQQQFTAAMRRLIAEITKPPKPFKVPKTYVGPDGKRHRIPYFPPIASRNVTPSPGAKSAVNS